MLHQSHGSNVHCTRGVPVHVRCLHVAGISVSFPDVLPPALMPSKLQGSPGGTPLPCPTNSSFGPYFFGTFARGEGGCSKVQ